MISYDSTNKNCQAGDIEIVDFRHVKEDKGLPIFNYSIAYDCNNREPLFYETYPGSIFDISQLQLMMNKAASYGYKNAGFILDRGYFSGENIRYMDHLGYGKIYTELRVQNRIFINNEPPEKVVDRIISEYDLMDI